MKYVDFMLHPHSQPYPSDWDNFQSSSFICVNCEKVYKGRNSKLYYFPDLDFAFHRHQNNVYYRAYRLDERGSVHIGIDDSESTPKFVITTNPDGSESGHLDFNERVSIIQFYGIILDGKGDYKHVYDLAGEEFYAASKKFFDNMRLKGREIVPGTAVCRTSSGESWTVGGDKFKL